MLDIAFSTVLSSALFASYGYVLELFQTQWPSESEPDDAADLTSEKGDVHSHQEFTLGDAFFDTRGGDGFYINSTWEWLLETSRNANGIELFMLGLVVFGSVIMIAKCLPRRRSAEQEPIQDADEFADEVDDGGCTRLYRAVENRDVVTVRELLQAGAETNWPRNDTSATPLFAASLQGDGEVAGLLIAAGADVNRASQGGFNPLSIAAQQGHTEVVRRLLEADADVKATTAVGATPLSMALMRGYDDMADLLRTFGAEEPPTAVLREDTEDELSSDSESVPSTSESESAWVPEYDGTLLIQIANAGEPPLFFASREDHAEMARQMIEAGADVNAKLDNTRTPLHWAAQNDSKEVATSLIDAGADVNAKTNSGLTPRSIAENKGCSQIASLFKDDAPVLKAHTGKKRARGGGSSRSEPPEEKEAAAAKCPKRDGDIAGGPAATAEGSSRGEMNPVPCVDESEVVVIEYGFP